MLAISLLLVLGLGFAITMGLWLAPAWIWTSLFGVRFGMAGDLPYLLMLYAGTQRLFPQCCVHCHEMSHKIANTALVQLAFSAVLIGGVSTGTMARLRR